MYFVFNNECESHPVYHEDCKLGVSLFFEQNPDVLVCFSCETKEHTDETPAYGDRINIHARKDFA